MPDPAALPRPGEFPGLILVGTDTGVGKTTIGRALLRIASRRRLRLLPFKPVETGRGEGLPRDAIDLIQASSITEIAVDEVCPYSFVAPVTPSVAARLEGRVIEPSALLLAARRLAARADALLVEGAGGLLSPWGPGFHLGTFAAQLRLPTLIVAANRLGTINHTALTAAECHRRNLPCVGFVLVDVAASPTPDHDTNAAELARETGLPFLGELRHLDPENVDRIADEAAATLAVTKIFDVLSPRGGSLAASP